MNTTETYVSIRALDSLWGYSYQMEPSGDLQYEIRRYPLMETEPFDPRTNAGGVICDREDLCIFAYPAGSGDE